MDFRELTIKEFRKKVSKAFLDKGLPIKLRWYEKTVAYLISPYDFSRLQKIEKSVRRISDVTPELTGVPCLSCGQETQVGDKILERKWGGVENYCLSCFEKEFG